MVEDLDWVDSSTRRLLEQVLDQGPASRTLTVLTCTPDFLRTWEPPDHVTRITLDRLSDDEVLEMILNLPGSEALPERLRQRIVERAGGVPLFGEELARLAHESGLAAGGGEPETAMELPATLEETLTARLELLPPAGQVAVQLGAVIGRQFSFEMLDRVSRLDAPQLIQQLDALVARGLFYQGGTPPRSTYMFKHPLLRVAAYRWSSLADRRRHHLKAAEVLAADPAVREEQPEILAHHCAEAGRLEEAVAYHQLSI